LRLARLEALSAPDPATAFARLLAASVRGFDLDAFAQSCNLTAPECEALVALHPVKICHDGNARIVFDADYWNALRREIVEVLKVHHGKHPELLGLDEARVHAALRPLVAKSLLRDAIAELCEAGILDRCGVIIHLSGHRARPTPAEAALWKRVEPTLAANGVRPPRVRELVDLIGIALDRLESFLARAEELGWVHRVAENRYFLPATLHELERIAERLAAEYADGTFAAADFNRASGIGRNLTIKVLEYFDRTGTTRRHGDRRSALRALPRTSQS
jgi:selenocysteine-specific elongation factor